MHGGREGVVRVHHAADARRKEGDAAGGLAGTSPWCEHATQQQSMGQSHNVQMHARAWAFCTRTATGMNYSELQRTPLPLPFVFTRLVPVAARYASGGIVPYTTETPTPAFSHTLPPCRTARSHQGCFDTLKPACSSCQPVLGKLSRVL